MGVNEKRDFDVLVYGAASTTARQCLQLINRDPMGLSWVCAGRNREKVEEALLEAGLGCPVLAFPLTGNAVEAAVLRARVVLNFAGPYLETGFPLAEACAKYGTHYVDLSGETAWFEVLRNLLQEDARANSVCILPATAYLYAVPEVGYAKLKSVCSLQKWKDSSITVVYTGKSSHIASGTVNTLVQGLATEPPLLAADGLKTVKAGTRWYNYIFCCRFSTGGNNCGMSAIRGYGSAQYFVWYRRATGDDRWDVENMKFAVNDKTLIDFFRRLAFEVMFVIWILVLVISPERIRRFFINLVCMSSDTVEGGFTGADVVLEDVKGSKKSSKSCSIMNPTMGPYRASAAIAMAACHSLIKGKDIVAGVGGIGEAMSRDFAQLETSMRRVGFSLEVKDTTE